MGQFLRINGDYNIKCDEGSKITLDTGEGVGEVRITGDLVVEGETTTVQAENLNVEDNIITVNAGETGAGVTLRYAGIQVDRGSLPPVGVFYDEITDSWIFAQGGPGVREGDPATPFSYDQSRIRVKEILTDANDDLTLIGTGTGVVKVSGTTTYEQEIINRDAADPGSADDILTNKKYVDDAIQNQPTFQIVAPQSQDTRVVIADKELEESPPNPTVPGSPAYFNDTTGFSTFGESAVSVIVDGALVSQFYNDKLIVGVPGTNGIEIDGTNFEIRTELSVTDQNIFIKTAGTGKLQTNYALQLENIAEVPAYVTDSNLLYSATPDIGTSGIWFVNDSAQVSKRNGELISKDKALVFSILF
jgi:hypothetical protein